MIDKSQIEKQNGNIAKPIVGCQGGKLGIFFGIK
jgi:hypothetical protein